jgi:hypothetical protein
MVIPVNTQQGRIKITLGVAIQQPVVLGISVSDPAYPNTHYLRRKVRLWEPGSHEIELPLPVTPAKALVEIYDKDSSSDKRFTVKRFDVEPLGETSIWAEPARHRFMDFAIDFARKAGYAAPGLYPSKDYEFLIHYLPIITDEDGYELVTPARIHRYMPRVQLSQRLFTQFSIPVRIAILAHEGCHYFKDTRSEKEADLCGIKYYLDAGFPSIEALYAATEVFLKHPDTVKEVHTRRARDIRDFIDKYRQREPQKA